MGGILGLIPARSGSVGVPRKNIRPLAGRPLIVYTVDAARASALDRIIVSTDSEEIASVAVASGAERPFLRPAALATGTTRAIEVVRNALDFFAEREHWTPDAVFYLQPTSPFRSAIDIDQALTLLRTSEDADSVMSVAPVRDHPSFAWTEKSGRLVPVFPGPRPERRQDLIPMVVENNAIVLSRTSYLDKAVAPDSLLINLASFVPMPVDFPVAVDIDTEADFRFADFLMRDHLGMLRD
jgi:CMP-N-acetylneuraminic acid synthetase